MRRAGLLAACAAFSILTAGCAATGGMQPGEDTVVYHFSEGLEQASDGLRNIGNHLEVNPNAKIVVVGHAKGVDFLMKDMNDKNGNKYEDLVEQLKASCDMVIFDPPPCTTMVDGAALLMALLGALSIGVALVPVRGMPRPAAA